MHPALPTAPAGTPALLWDIYCRVIDNFGDIGVCWRLARDLVNRGQRVRLWTDDARPLDWMTLGGERGSLQVLDWPTATMPSPLPELACGDVVIEAFGCELPTNIQCALAERHAQGRAARWINLEYLSAEPHAKRSNGLPSPVMSGPAKGLFKTFVFPGFEPGTAGLLLEQGLLQARAAQRTVEAVQTWRSRWGIAPGERVISLFCYEPPALERLLQRLSCCAEPVVLMVTAGRAQQALAQAWQQLGWPPITSAFSGNEGHPPATTIARHQGLRCVSLPWLTQQGFDQLLWHCDLNFVRGEDSLVRALWAGQPFVWQAYRQDGGAHHAKVQALMDVLHAPSAVRQWHGWWNDDALAAPFPEISSWPWDQPGWLRWISSQVGSLSQWCDLSQHLLQLVSADLDKTVGSRGEAVPVDRFKG